MSYYSQSTHSKTSEEHLKEMVRLWNYEAKWLNFSPRKGTKPLSLDDIKIMRDQLPENRQFAFAMVSGNIVSCENKHGGLFLLKHGYVPNFDFSERGG